MKRQAVMILFEYHESDDADASIYGLTWDEVVCLIHDHNEFYETNYQTIQEFNDGEVYREFVTSNVSIASLN